MTPRSGFFAFSIIAIVAVLATAPAAAAMTEGEYLGFLGDKASAIGQSAASASDILQSWMGGHLSDTQAKSDLGTEQSAMQAVFNALSTTVPPCTAYTTLHTELKSAAWDFEQSFYYDIQGIGAAGTSLMTTASDYANSATVHMQNARDEQQSIAYPACPAGATTGGTGGVGTAGGPDPIVFGILGVIAVGAVIGAITAYRVHRRKKAEDATPEVADRHPPEKVDQKESPPPR